MERTTPRLGAGVRSLRRLAPALGLVPFLGYLVVFLLIPTVAVGVGAVDVHGQFMPSALTGMFDEAPVRVLKNSLILSVSTAVIGSVLGAALSAVVVGAPTTSLVRRAVTSMAGVLAQFGGVTLAFAFIATLAYSGVVTVAFRNLGIDIFGTGWLFDIPGLILVYTYFQIPLMVIVFLPALEGLRPQWREAAYSLGATRWQYFTRVVVPLLRPPFLASALLLFANAFAAYATAAALVSQGNPIVPLLIRNALTSEVLLGRQNLAYVLALEMVIVVAVVMTVYGWLVRRTSRWLR